MRAAAFGPDISGVQKAVGTVHNGKAKAGGSGQQHDKNHFTHTLTSFTFSVAQMLWEWC